MSTHASHPFYKNRQWQFVRLLAIVLGLAFLATAGTVGTAQAQSAEWLPGLPLAGPNSSLEIAVTDSDGNIYIGGRFDAVADTQARSIAKWDGTSWSAFGDGFNFYWSVGTVNDIAFSADGTLYAAGWFQTAGSTTVNNVARWDGSSWQPLGSGLNDSVNDITFGPDGTLYASGGFTQAGGQSANYIAKWDGTSWSSLGSGLAGGVYGTEGFKVAFDSSGNLYAAGEFDTAGGVPVNNIGKWDGTTWSNLGGGLTGSGGGSISGETKTVAVDSQDNVYVGGVLGFAGGVPVNRVAKWDGTSWSAMGDGFNSYVWDMAVGSDDTIYATGWFSEADGNPVGYIAQWDGTEWLPMGSGMDRSPYGLTIDANGHLFAAGQFTTAGDVAAQYFARWDGTAWHSYNSNGFTGNIDAIAVDNANNVYVGGSFAGIGDTSFGYIAQWDGATWSGVGGGVSSQYGGSHVAALVTDGNGNLYVGGHFDMAGNVSANNIAKWDGTSWSALGDGIIFPAEGSSPQVYALAIDSSGNLYAGGHFSHAGGTAANYIAKWDGTSWSALGDGVSGAEYGNPSVYAIATSGSTVYAGGDFLNAGGQEINNLAKWNGSSWGHVDNDYEKVPDGTVNALAIYGGDLYVGGDFYQLGYDSTSYIARYSWNGWDTFGDSYGGYDPKPLGFDRSVIDLVVGRNGTLYAIGEFEESGDTTVNRIATFTSEFNYDTYEYEEYWEPVDGGADGDINALGFDSLGNVYIGGQFGTVGGGTTSAHFAIYGAPRPAPELSISKTVNNETPALNDTITYSVQINNTGTAAANNVTLQDVLPEGLSLVSTSGCTNDPSGLPTCEVGTINAAGQKTITYQTTVTETVIGTAIINTASVTSTKIATPVSASATITTANAVPVAMADSYTTTVDAPLTISFVDLIANASDANNDTLTVISDTVPTLGSLSGTATEFVYTPPANRCGTDSFDYKVNDGTADSVAASLTITIEGCTPTLSVEQAVSEAAPAVGDAITYTMTISNGGNGDATNVTLTGVLPSELAFVSSAGCVNDPTGLPACEVGTIAASDSATVTVQVTITEAAEGLTITNTVGVTATEAMVPVTDKLAITVLQGGHAVGIDGDGNFVLDLSDEGVPNEIELSVSGGNLIVTDANGNLPDGTTYSIPLADITGSIIINGADGVDDALKISEVDGKFPANTAIQFDGAGQATAAGDELIIEAVTGAGRRQRVRVTHINASDGTVALDNSVTVDFAGLEPVAVLGAPDDMQIDLPPTADSATLTAAAAGQSLLAGATFEDTTFSNPVEDGLLALSLGAGDDRVELASAEFLTNTAISIVGGDDADTVIYSAAERLVAGAMQLAISAETVILTDTATLPVMLDSTHDQIVISDTTTLTLSNPTLSLTAADGFTLTKGDVFTLINSLDAGTTITGTFAGLAEGDIIHIGDTPLQLSYAGGDGNDVTLTVGNIAPVGVADSFTTNDYTVLTDSLVDNDEDADGDVLSAELITGPVSGTLALSTTGSFVFTPTIGVDGDITFTYRVSDGVAFSAVTPVTISVDLVPAPSASVPTETITVSVGARFAQSITVSDAETLVEDSAWLSAFKQKLSNEYNLEGSPERSDLGLQAVSISVGNQYGVTTTYTLTLNVVNDAPTASRDYYSGIEDEVIVPRDGLLSNDYDVNQDVLTATLVTAPSSGDLTLTADGSFVFTPTLNFNGDVTFTYKATDGLADSAETLVTFHFKGVNDSPTAVDDSYVTEEGTYLVIIDSGVEPPDDPLKKAAIAAQFGAEAADIAAQRTSASRNEGGESVSSVGVLANDIDPEGDFMTASIVEQPSNGFLMFNEDGTFFYAPRAGFTGTDTFTYYVSESYCCYRSDGADGYQEIATVTITVTPEESEPLPLVFIEGWNLFGFPWQTDTVTNALAPLDGSYNIVWGYDEANDAWQVHDAERVGTPFEVMNDLKTLSYGQGYWIHITKPITVGGGSGDGATRSVTQGRSLSNPPMLVYGFAMADGVISAHADTTTCATTIAATHDGISMYALTIDDSCTGPITIKLNGIAVNSTSWDNTQSQQIDVTSVPTAVALNGQFTASSDMRTVITLTLLLTLCTLPVALRRQQD